MHLKIVIAKKWTFITPCSEDGSSKLYSFLGEAGQRYQRDIAGLLSKMDKVSGQERGPAILNIDICHQIDGSIYQISHGSVRMLFFYSEFRRKLVVCAAFFKKKGQVTPKSMINEAKSVERLYALAEKTGKVTIMDDEEESK